MDTLSTDEAARLLHLTPKRVQSLARAGKLPAARVGRKWLFPRTAVERLLLGGPEREGRGDTIEISARNRLEGVITQIAIDGLLAEVRLRIGDQEVVSIITRSSAERMALAVGDRAYAIVKSTEVMIGKDGGEA